MRTLLAAVLAVLSANLSVRADEVLTGSQIVELVSGQRVSGYSYRRETRFEARFSSGQGVQIDVGLFELEGRWSVKRDRLCVSFPTRPEEDECGKVVKLKTDRYEVRDQGRAIQRFTLR